ncbi:MAG: alcohol dehydrogenase catalytic domain-containing protein [Streptosporangiales bacterium]|nr:alcohol dehydrogenase catalytic domain-containing protein [Streptosporangiales bacterium]
MQTARIHGAADVRLGDEPVPTPAAGESLVQITAVGLCGSDLHWYAEGGIGSIALDRPLVAGHELAGVVTGGELDGTLVAVDPAIPCEQCAQCHRGHRNLCPQVVFAGQSPCDGGLREYLAWPTHLLFPLPDPLTATDGAMLEPLGVALHALDLGHVAVGTTVTVVGCGPVGLLLAQVARLAGATTVYAVEPLPHRRAAAQRLGVDLAVAPGEPLPAETDVTFEIAGPGEAVELAIRATRPGGRVVLGGIPSDDRTAFTASAGRRKGLTLALARRMNDAYPRAIDLVAKGLVDVRSLVSHEFPLAEVAKAFRTADARDGLKVVVHPDR